MGGGPTLPTPSTPGYGTFTDKNTGRKYTACYCLAQWLSAAERLGKAKGLIKVGLDVVQLTGDADKSGGTHSQGGVFDVKQRTDAWVSIYRNMGARASWRRDGSSWAGNEHAHGIIPCAHHEPAEYQVTAQRRGYNGLGQGYYNGQLLWGYGGKDPHPNPSVFRTWREGIEWAEAEIKKLQPATAPAPAPIPAPPSEEDELMAITVKNPVTGEQWPLETALWSIWTYAYGASVDAKAALNVAKVAAAKGEPLTAEETEAAVQEALKGAVVSVSLNYPVADAPKA